MGEKIRQSEVQSWVGESKYVKMSFNKKAGIILSVDVDDIKMVGKAHHLKKIPVPSFPEKKWRACVGMQEAQP